MDDLIKLTGHEISSRIAKGEAGADEVYGFFTGRVRKMDKRIKSFVRVHDGSCVNGGGSALAGVPIALKDNICVKGLPLTCASRVLSGHISVYDAAVVEKIKKAGLRILGFTNMDEFAFGSSTETSCYGPTLNPWDETKVPGGSSGGSAAAVCARLVPFALGSDTGGSIRQPASLCGVVGFKPTYGRVSRRGLVAFGSSLDQIGPITTNFHDCAHLLNIICGYDELDSTSYDLESPDFSQSLNRSCRGLVVGIPKEYFAHGLDKEVGQALSEVKSVFSSKGVTFRDISLPHTDYAIAVYYLVASSEASSNLQRFDGVRYGLRAQAMQLWQMYSDTRGQGLGQEAKRRVFLGAFSLSSGYYDAYYMKALKVRRLIKDDFDRAFSSVDAILTPTSSSEAFGIGEKTKDPLSMYLSDVYTSSANLAGLPAVSFPCGFTKKGLPLGAQLIAREFDEETLIALGSQFQQCTGHHKVIPPGFE